MIWFTSDTHFGHENVLKFTERPWETIWQMNDAIVDSINGRVAVDDELYILGDFSFKMTAQDAYALRKRIACRRIHLIPGNHDKDWTQPAVAGAFTVEPPICVLKIADARTDALHKVTTMLADENQVLCMEDLNAKGMVRNHHLAKAVSDASFGEFARLLEYKCAERGRTLVRVGRFYPSSKTCSSCGHRLDILPLSVRSWDCPACGAHHDRDVNAARNILTEGKRILSNTEGTAGHAGTVAAITA